MPHCYFCKEPTENTEHIALFNETLPVCKECAPSKELKAAFLEMLQPNGKVLDFHTVEPSAFSANAWLNIFTAHMYIYSRCPNKRSFSILKQVLLWAYRTDNSTVAQTIELALLNTDLVIPISSEIPSHLPDQPEMPKLCTLL